MADELILASLSPFRAQLLANAGLAFSVAGARLNEREIETQCPALSPKQLAQKLAQEKSMDVSRRFPHALVIGCDQTLELEGKALHKPADMQDASRRLLALSGKTHALHSAVSLCKHGKLIWSDCVSAHMTVRHLDPQFVGHHLARVGDSVLASVGAYQLEGEGIQLFDRIEGDWFTIIGLPMLPLLAEFRKLGVIDG